LIVATDVQCNRQVGRTNYFQYLSMLFEG
jgi:hypothetical protein